MKLQQNTTTLLLLTIALFQVCNAQVERRLAVAVQEEDRLWPAGVVCYSVKSKQEFTPIQLNYFLEAMIRVETTTNIRFLHIDNCKTKGLHQYCNNCKNFVNVQHSAPTDLTSCSSVNGLNRTGTNEMTLADACFETRNDPLRTNYGTCIHTIGHAVGLYHEHRHPNRTIGIFWNEVEASKRGLLKRRESTRKTVYDPESIMHYPVTNTFCMPKFCPVGSTANTDSCVVVGTRFCDLDEKEGECVHIKRSQCDVEASKKLGQRHGLSKLDTQTILAMYPSAAWPLEKSTLPSLNKYKNRTRNC